MNSISDIKHAFYINLQSRPDRKQHVENQLKNIGIHAERFNAIKMKNGAIGCSMSHLKCLQIAKKENWEQVFICEDDIVFSDIPTFKTQMMRFIENETETDTDILNWDVLIIGGNNAPPFQYIQPKDIKPKDIQTSSASSSTSSYIIKVNNCQTTTGYIVRKHYYDTLIKNFHDGINLFMRNPENKREYALDIFWKQLQQKDNWFMIIPATIHQLDDYSDIEERVTTYKEIMLDLDKEEFFRKRQEMFELQLRQQIQAQKREFSIRQLLHKP